MLVGLNQSRFIWKHIQRARLKVFVRTRMEMGVRVLHVIVDLLFIALVAAPVAWSHPGPGIAIDRQGQVFFVHPVRHRIMRVDVAGKLTVFVQGEESHKLSVPHHLVLDIRENLYSVGDRDGVIWRIAPDGATTRIYPPEDRQGIGFFGRGGDPFILDHQGKIYGIHSRVDEYTQILQVGLDGRINILAGGDYGMADGQGAQAKFANLHVGCLAFSPDGSLYLTDSLVWVRKISPLGTVTTLVDSSGERRRFQSARGLTFDAGGNLYVADGDARCIYKITPRGSLSRVAGSGKRGSQDGAAQTASFLEPVGVAVSRDGAVYVLDYLGDDPNLRKISPDAVVTTIAKCTNSE
jgi:DNA-binding beta-propeller fold protein YncE